MDSFQGKSVKELQKYLRDRGVVTARYVKAGPGDAIWGHSSGPTLAQVMK